MNTETEMHMGHFVLQGHSVWVVSGLHAPLASIKSPSSNRHCLPIIHYRIKANKHGRSYFHFHDSGYVSVQYTNNIT